MKNRIRIFVASSFVIGFMALFAFNVYSQGKNTEATPKKNTMEMSCCDTEMMGMMKDCKMMMKDDDMKKDKNEMNKNEMNNKEKKRNDAIKE
jgi:hypothetical protein